MFVLRVLVGFSFFSTSLPPPTRRTQNQDARVPRAPRRGPTRGRSPARRDAHVGGGRRGRTRARTRSIRARARSRADGGLSLGARARRRVSRDGWEPLGTRTPRGPCDGKSRGSRRRRRGRAVGSIARCGEARGRAFRHFSRCRASARVVERGSADSVHRATRAPLSRASTRTKPARTSATAREASQEQRDGPSDARGN